MERQRLPTGTVEAVRAAGLCGIVAFVTFNVGWIAGDLAQPRAFSPTNDDISYLRALTASKPWLYDQLAANVSGALVVALGVGLWRALGPSRLGRAAPPPWSQPGSGRSSTGSSGSTVSRSTRAAATTRGTRTPTRSSRASPWPRPSSRLCSWRSLPAAPAMARLVASDDRHRAGGHRRQHRLLAHRRRRGNAYGHRRRVPDDRVHRVPADSGRRGPLKRLPSSGYETISKWAIIPIAWGSRMWQGYIHSPARRSGS